MLRSPNDESVSRKSQRNKKASSASQPRKDSGACDGGRSHRERGGDLPPGRNFPSTDVSVEEPVQRDGDSGVQAIEGGPTWSSQQRRKLPDTRTQRRAGGRKGGVGADIDGARLAQKKKDLDLFGDLRGRHLTAQDRSGLLEIIEFAQDDGVSCERACKLLELNPRAVYRWKCEKLGRSHGGGGGQNKITLEEESAVLEWVRAHPGQRCRRIAYELERAGVIFMGKTKVAEIMKKHGLQHVFERGKSRPDIPPQEMLLHEPWRKNYLWGMDWTWVRVCGKFMFLLVLIDWYSRKIIAWGIFHQITRFEVVSVVTDAVAIEEIEKLPKDHLRPRVVADHGSANTSQHTRSNIEFLGLELWLSGVGRPTGNARTERVIGTLKREEILLEGEYKNESEAQQKIGYAIFDYNHFRPNSGNGGFAPSAVHELGRKKLSDQRQIHRQKTETERRNYWKTNQGSLT
jgi:putative transposase